MTKLVSLYLISPLVVVELRLWVLAVPLVGRHAEGVDHLRRHVLRRPDGRLEERRGDGLVHARAQVEVAQLDRPRRVRVHAQHVLRLQQGSK